jgi:hypothetical protein
MFDMTVEDWAKCLLAALLVIWFFASVAFEPWPSPKEHDMDQQILTVRERNVIHMSLKSLLTMAESHSLRDDINAILPRIDELRLAESPRDDQPTTTPDQTNPIGHLGHCH